MLSRANLLALVALVALVALDLATRPVPATRAIGERLFPDLSLETAQAITVGNDAGESLRIERREGSWVLPAWDGFPADTWLVEELIAALEQQTDATLVARTPSEPEVFGLGAAAGPRVVVDDIGGRHLASYLQGSDLPRGPGASTGMHLTREGEQAVYRAPLVPRVSTSAESWMRTRTIDVPTAAVLALRLRFAGQRQLEFRRGPEGRWSTEVGEAPQVPLDRLLSGIGSLFHSGLAEVDDLSTAGLAPPLLEIAAVIAGEGGSETERSIAIGGDRADGGSYATSPQWPEPWIVVISAPMLGDLLEAIEGVVARATFPEGPESGGGAVGPAAPGANEGSTVEGRNIEGSDG
ncbi:DUF4340 domain-containing protein [Engelhardtia mirabilis]|uniref:DUF4340 domain-containing protein n=1 Tax=Engelhardtia mirabilis TaxID=2528011 RepID=A0A518BJ80_9BACT|nr:hypothetical protein Pla133_21090 [Planctomycetes bacterium Pla133]QDV01358.1 hypothetical protein Pla86_21090 [Planctomycetes bacterium Pla86]